MLHLPDSLHAALWAHARQDPARECVGALGGRRLECGQDTVWDVRTLYPLPNIAPHPDRAYLADPRCLLRALKAMRAENLELVGLYHSHPRGPQAPSETDRRLASYEVPYLIADLRSGQLGAYHLPGGQRVPLVVGAAPPGMPAATPAS
ncbi:Mov34/MPN/PAD-1 family protein [Deinococcus depolymerans]|uniref:M67 family metallopeptidase n=1 Tax=Deinococcus depolymerans TaxID=392408 RepID=A0ABN1BLN0_9DEIO